MAGRVESLNVAVAAAILVYAARRQRIAEGRPDARPVL
jgi:tRNA G18 (ribose-2'-O)-methylase SpoU